ncbi:Aspartate/glutamate/uridylate kinase [Dimargaris cristalligena]|uniref:Aspartokinase n=1 Tax=Dimargaris cristalligena TaxID=215637 RepID=A0A4Q0A0T9_9FUNG|nr:Aspartate/glutamate/uridylate kinase [Dimargaris cristalligena]|eukprot:RKP39051.1 Aspartate/glutamate/uridylate kinase [Dimargaris cristalligena]
MPAYLSNASNLPWLVLKFGGTSVGKFLDAITGTILKNALKHYRIVVVCSALSNDIKSKGTTSRLIRAAEAVLQNQGKAHIEIVEDIMQDHLAVAEQHIQDPDVLAQLKASITKECLRLKVFLEAAEVIDEVSPRSRDIIIGTGEKLACHIVAASLLQKGVDAQYVSLEKLIRRSFDINALDQTFYDYLADELATTIGGCGTQVPVVTGFFGPVPGSLLTTIGRGYTDLTAALIAVGIRAHELQVWKEVDGIFTADPRKVPSARLLKIITPEEAAELTYYGSEVIHPFTMEQVIRAHIPIRIKNVQNPDGCGTIIFPDLGGTGTTNSRSLGDVSSPTHSPRLLLENGYHLDLSRRHPTAVTIKDHVVVLNVHSNRKSVSHGFFAHIFSTLDKYGIVVDLISTSEVHVSMALGAPSTTASHSADGATPLEKAVTELSGLGTVDILRDMAILSLVGKQMRNMVGVAGKMFTTLAEANVNIEMISQGASEINISCIIHQDRAVDALRAIHNTLLDVSNISLVDEMGMEMGLGSD